MKRVVVFPVSGYINRLQAVASASLLAQELGWQLFVAWEPQEVAAAPANALFSEEFCHEFVRTEAQIDELFSIRKDSIPRYLTTDVPAGRITLAGHDHGEQIFMPELSASLQANSEIHTLAIAAGGHFGLTGSNLSMQQQEAFLRPARGAWYRNLQLNAEIEQRVFNERAARPSYLALHLRYTDRSHQVPSRRSISQALETLAARTKTRSLFIASDSAASRDEWAQRARVLGFEPWSVEHSVWDRSDPRSAHPALIDWRLLCGSEAMVYFSESSFAYEAAVASGGFDESIGLSPHKLSGIRAGAAKLFGAAISYPIRHGWFKSN
ncbi:MAG: hypothetical protein F2923_02245 [Actinobacteria bacterium]|uniref:Unannotated protein n=1 Tax=freshwater metagenome TaxID=449393 RepID=A0A6J7S6V3_9ZZZZ|nr:hypothetical protein [Actinomycetota bacterium]MTB27441.1 hypothetical protein [Actinomycetota bacterium]